MSFNFNSWIFKFWPLKDFEAITLPWGIYFKHDQDRTDRRIFNHEMVHAEQIEKVGVLRFYIQYFFEYLKNLIKYKNSDLAYRNISFEVEAYQKENI